MDEEVVMLEEQLTAAQNDIEHLQAQVADAEAREATRGAEIGELRRQLAAKEERLATQTVAQVRQHLEQQAQSLRVPAGAPVRGAPDVSSLTASEKIRAGLKQQ